MAIKIGRGEAHDGPNAQYEGPAEIEFDGDPARLYSRSSWAIQKLFLPPVAIAVPVEVSEQKLSVSRGKTYKLVD